MKKLLASSVVAASVIGGGAAGAVLFTPTVASALQDDTTTTTTVDDATTDERPEHGEHLAEALAPLVDDGTLTQAQADAVVARLLEARPEGGHRGPGGGMGGPGGGFGGRGGPLAVEELTEVLGLDAATIGEALRDGQTLAELAEANGATADEVIAVLVTAAEERLAEAVADGHLTQAEADEKAADLTERITEMVNEGGGFGGRR